jgi:hypothetical protein
MESGLALPYMYISFCCTLPPSICRKENCLIWRRPAAKLSKNGKHGRASAVVQSPLSRPTQVVKISRCGIK